MADPLPYVALRPEHLAVVAVGVARVRRRLTLHECRKHVLVLLGDPLVVAVDVPRLSELRGQRHLKEAGILDVLCAAHLVALGDPYGINRVELCHLRRAQEVDELGGRAKLAAARQG